MKYARDTKENTLWIENEGVLYPFDTDIPHPAKPNDFLGEDMNKYISDKDCGVPFSEFKEIT